MNWNWFRHHASFIFIIHICTYTYIRVSTITSYSWLLLIYRINSNRIWIENKSFLQNCGEGHFGDDDYVEIMVPVTFMGFRSNEVPSSTGVCINRYFNMIISFSMTNLIPKSIHSLTFSLSFKPVIPSVWLASAILF